MKHRLKTAWSVCALSLLCLGAARADEPVHVALVSNLPAALVGDGLALAETALADTKSLVLLERQGINRILEEHQLALSGEADAATAVQVGRLLTVDLLAMLAGDPAVEGSQALALVVFDARTGVRLEDRAVATAPEKMAAGVKAAIDAALAKHRLGRKVVKTISVVGIRNVDLGASRTNWCSAIGRLLERDLCASPQVGVLDRTYLDQVVKERALAPAAPADALASTMLRLDLELARDGDERVAATVTITAPQGEKRKASVRVGEAELGHLGALLMDRVLKELDARPVTAVYDRRLEARRLLNEAKYQLGLARVERAIVFAEAAMALAPEDRSLWPDTTEVFTSYAGWLLLSSENRAANPSRLSVGFQPRCSAEDYEATIAYLLRAVKLFIRTRQHEAERGGIRIAFSAQEDHLYQGELFFEPVLWNLRNYRGQRSSAARESLRTLLSRYRHLQTDLLLGAVLDKLGTAEYASTVANRWRLRMESLAALADDWEEWSRLTCELEGRVLVKLDQTGPVSIEHACLRMPAYRSSYVEMLAFAIPRGDDVAFDGARLGEKQVRALRELYERMVQHRLPAVKILGGGGRLWADIRSNNLTGDEVQQRMRKILDFAEAKIADPGVEPADVERAACYDAAISVCDAIERLDPSVRPARERLYRFMTSRRELTLSVVFALGGNHWDHGKLEEQTTGFRGVYGPARSLDHGESSETVAARLAPVRQLLAASTTRYPDNNCPFLEALLQQLPGGPSLEAVRAPLWTRARLLIDSGEDEKWCHPSAPVVVGDKAYSVVVTSEGNERIKQLVRIDLPEGAVERLGRISQPWSGPLPAGASAITMYRRWNTLGRLWVHDDRVYCPSANYGGIFVFPVDGSEPEFLSPKTCPGMVTGDIDSIAILDGGLLALSSGDPSAYVLWYDLGTKKWETIASSHRVEKKTLLDYPEHYLNATIVDPPRHRIFFSLRQNEFPGLMHSGLFAFDTRTRTISKLFAFPHNGPSWMQSFGPERLLVVFPKFDEEFHRVFEFDMTNDRWRLTMSNVGHRWCEVDGKPVEDLAKGPVRSNRDWVIPEDIKLDQPRYPGKHRIYPPFEIIDDRLWCFHPLGRLGADGRTLEQGPVLDRRSIVTYFSTPGLPNTLEYIPKHRQVLYSGYKSIWLLDLPPATASAAAMASRAATERLEPGPAAHWKLDEGSGDRAADSSGKGHTATLRAASWSADNARRALHCDGIGAYALVGNPESLNFAGVVTLVAWIKPEANDDFRDIISHGYTQDPKAEGVALRIDRGRYRIGSWDGAEYQAKAAMPAEDIGRWVHLAGVYDGQSWRLYRNGKQVAEVEHPVGALACDANWAIGASGRGNERFFKGHIRDVRIYRRALSAEEIQSLFGESP
jgi:tetratricopeptide (TPR) repeat protein